MGGARLEDSGFSLGVESSFTEAHPRVGISFETAGLGWEIMGDALTKAASHLT